VAGRAALLTGTTRDEMATISAFADVDTEATFRDGTLAITGHLRLTRRRLPPTVRPDEAS
jgi:hypothetical protein